MLRAALVSLLVLTIGTVCTGRQVVEWTRKLDTCDPQDHVITQGTTRFIYALNDERPDGPDNLKMHKPKHRGTTSARLFEKPKNVPLPPDVEHFDVIMPKVNVTFFPNSPDTAYWCTGIKLPVLPEKVHLVRWEPVLEERNLDVLHHMLVMECPTMEDEDVGLDGECGQSGSAFPQREIQCVGGSVLGAWAVGGGPMDLPPSLGLPLFPDKPRYLFIQIHYNRADLQRPPIVDSSGMRFFYTKTLRPLEGGVFNVGMLTDWSYKIPAGQTAYTYDGICPGECTQHFAHPIKVVSTLLHAHNIGSALTLRHWRKGVELPHILTDPSYDFNFQDFESDYKGTTIYPGDELHMSCAYDSTGRKGETRFGLSSIEEMCLAYFIYYPRLSDHHCLTGLRGAGLKERFAYCAGTAVNYTINHAQPLPPPTCTYTPPPAGRTTPTLFDINTFDPSKYNRSTETEVDGRSIKLYWNINEKKGEVTFAADVDTDGWFGIGLSRNGGMVGSDIMTAHVYKNATGHWVPSVVDRMASAYAKPQADHYQDFYDIRISRPHN